MNDYIDYNNEEVSNYTKVVDPRELNVVERIKSLADHKPPIIEDDKVSVEKMKSSHNEIIEESESMDEAMQREIDIIKDDEFIIVGGED